MLCTIIAFVRTLINARWGIEDGLENVGGLDECYYLQFDSYEQTGDSLEDSVLVSLRTWINGQCRACCEVKVDFFDGRSWSFGGRLQTWQEDFGDDLKSLIEG